MPYNNRTIRDSAQGVELVGEFLITLQSRYNKGKHFYEQLQADQIHETNAALCVLSCNNRRNLPRYECRNTAGAKLQTNRHLLEILEEFLGLIDAGSLALELQESAEIRRGQIVFALRNQHQTTVVVDHGFVWIQYGGLFEFHQG
jgi:hypothetical protein